MNYNILSKVIIFTVGAAIGSAVTWKIVKDRYEQIANEEIESVKEMYGRSDKTDDISTEDELSEEDKKTYNEEVSRLNYSAFSGSEEKGDKEVSKPYVIKPDEFGNEYEYDAVSLNYYADGILTDDFDNIIEDVDGTVGEESLNHFGEYEEDSVFVRNDKYKTDYEILRDNRNFSDVYKSDDD